MLRSFTLAAFLATFLSAPHCASSADAAGTITILEGEAFVYRGAGRLRALEGVRLVPGDIVETGETGFAQIELSDRSVLQLGAVTRVMLNARARPQPERWVYVLDGWGKMSGMQRDARGDAGYAIRAPLFEIAPTTGVVVFKIKPAEATIYVERGEVRLVERQTFRPAAEVTLKFDQHYRRKSGAPGAVVSRAAQATAMQQFASETPRAFRDSLPSRRDQFRQREVKPAPAPEFAYADVEPWLKAEPAVRRDFVQRWRARIDDRAFRAALVANLAAHPEWDPMLFPAKYLPDDPLLDRYLVERPSKKN